MSLQKATLLIPRCFKLGVANSEDVELWPCKWSQQAASPQGGRSSTGRIVAMSPERAYRVMSIMMDELRVSHSGVYIFLCRLTGHLAL